MIDHKKFADKAMAALHGHSDPEAGEGGTGSDTEPDAENPAEHSGLHHMKMFIHAVHAKDHHAAMEAHHALKKY